METVNVAFIGAGNFANTHHYPNLHSMEDVRIVAIAELDQERLQRTADKYDVPGRYDDYHEMLEQEDIDAVFVIMPPMGLTPIALDVIEAGKHTFTEKPAGVHTEETIRMAKAAEQAGVKSAVGCNRRYSHVLRKAKEEVLKRGPVSEMMAEFHKYMEEAYHNISILHCDGVHVVDAMRDVCGEPESVHAHADHWYSREGWENSYNRYSALMRFENGASGLFTVNRQCGGRYERFEIHGQGISAYVRAPQKVEIYRDGESEPEIYTGEQLAGTDDTSHTYGYFVEVREFIDAIKGDGVPLTNFSDNVKTMQLCDSIAGGEHLDMTG